jgi:hypothetical protein
MIPLNRLPLPNTNPIARLLKPSYPKHIPVDFQKKYYQNLMEENVKETLAKSNILTKLKQKIQLYYHMLMQHVMPYKDSEQELVKHSEPNLLIKGLPLSDAYLKEAESEKQAAWTNFPQEMKAWTQAELKRIIHTYNAKLPSDVKRIPYEERGKNGEINFLIRRPAGKDHTQLYFTNIEGDVLKQAVVRNDQLPEVVVVDSFLEKSPQFIATHGDLVVAFIKRFNPFVKILKKNVEIKSVDEEGKTIYRLPNSKGVKVLQNIYKKTQRPGAKHPIALNSSVGAVGYYDKKPSYDEVLSLCHPLQRTQLKLRHKLIEEGVPIYQAAGNQAAKNEDGTWMFKLEATVPKTYVVGGTKRGSQELHPDTSSVEYLTHTAPFEYKVSFNETGINTTGGNTDIDGVDFTYAQLSLNTSEAIQIYQGHLPSLIEGTSLATPFVLAQETLREIPQFISEHANKLPLLPKALLEQAKRLGVLDRLEAMGFRVDLVKPKPPALPVRDEAIRF